jgi:predicted RNA-binding protein
MNYWLFIVTTHKVDGREYSGEDILRTRFEDGFWGLGEQTPNRKHLQAGDKILFYMGSPRQEFVASATLDSDNFRVTSDQEIDYSHGEDFYASEYGVKLSDQVQWANPVSADGIVDQLEFIENKQYWYSYFQGGVRKLTEHDFRTIASARDLPFSERIRTEEDIENESEFALEAHLEEFMDANWHRIRFPFSLRRYEAEDQTGRQFPAGQWSIDFLCVDDDSEDFVVIELKRGKSSDSTVGQVLRYIGWVEENLCNEGQAAKGIIIAREIDDALRYAVRGLENVSVMTYKVDFELRPDG